jgi:ankyrin repeat protein
MKKSILIIGLFFVGNFSIVHAGVVNAELANRANTNDLRGVIDCLNRGADVNIKDFFGKAPLHCAAINGNVEMVHALIQHGATIDSETNNGETPLMFAIMHASDRPNDYYRVIMHLIDQGADVNHQDRLGNRPLLFANRNIQLKNILIGRGAFA